MAMHKDFQNDAATWRISVLRSQNFHRLLHRQRSHSNSNFNGWRPLIVLTADPHLGQGHNHCTVHETTLGSDGQNPNTKIGLDLQNPRFDTKLLFEVVHFPQAAKKKARRLNKTVLGSCVYEMGELVELARSQERNNPKQVVSITLTSSGSGPRARHMKRARKDNHNAVGNIYNYNKGSPIISSAGPSLQIKLTPPKGSPFILPGPSRSSVPSSLSSCEEDSEGEGEESAMENHQDEERKPLIDEEKDDTSTNLSPPKPKPNPLFNESSGLRKRRRVRRRVVKGYACDSEEEYHAEEEEEEEEWVSGSASESGTEELDTSLDENLDENEEGDDSSSFDPSSSSDWSRWSLFDHVAPVLGILGMAQPNPGILPSHWNTNTSNSDSNGDQNQKQRLDIDIETAPDLEEEPEHGEGERDIDPSPDIDGDDEDDTREWELEWWERVLCLFTVYQELRIAEYEELQLSQSSIGLGLIRDSGAGVPISPGMASAGAGAGSAPEGLYPLSNLSNLHRYDRIYQRLQIEWTYVGGLLVGLAAIDAAIFAISPSSSSSPSFSEVASGKDAGTLSSSASSLFPVDSFARKVVSLSTISTALGLLCDAYLLMNYAWNDVGTFVNRARPSPLEPSTSSPQPDQSPIPSTTTTTFTSQSWGYFALSSRIPAICMVLSILFIGVFLLTVASEAAPPAGLWILGVLVGMGMGMQYVVRVGKVLGRGVRVVVRGVGSGVMWVGNGVRGVGGKIRGLVGRNLKKDSDLRSAVQSVPAVAANLDGREKSMVRPLPARVHPESRRH
ncbi:hypothetical protein EV361DRAFT_1019539 [Lentinula raphanica]|nr:hypothetical protein EV361DRAFT_1019539 [Lentinula raphanica]